MQSEYDFSRKPYTVINSSINTFKAFKFFGKEIFLYLYLYCCLLSLQQFDMLDQYTVEFTSINVTKPVVWSEN